MMVRSTAIYRIQVCRATFAPGSASSPRKSVVGIWPHRNGLHPTRQSRPPVLVTVKDKSLRDGLQLPLTVTARGGQFEARSARGDGRQPAERGDEETNQSKLDNHRPIQV